MDYRGRKGKEKGLMLEGVITPMLGISQGRLLPSSVASQRVSIARPSPSG